MVSIAAVIGATGGIGAALVEALTARGMEVHAFSRTGTVPVDVTDEASIAAAAATLPDAPTLVFCATGMLHDGVTMPERALKELDGARLAHMFAVNTIGPSLVLKHFAPLLPRDRRSAIAVLSARVGSIGDNRTGGWYGYRASKAALNMIVRCAAIELSRSRPQAVCVGLHPGTVATGLSRPFQARVAAGRLFTPDDSAAKLLAVLDDLQSSDSGGCFAWDGTRIEP